MRSRISQGVYRGVRSLGVRSQRKSYYRQRGQAEFASDGLEKGEWKAGGDGDAAASPGAGRGIRRLRGVDDEIDLPWRRRGFRRAAIQNVVSDGWGRAHLGCIIDVSEIS